MRNLLGLTVVGISTWLWSIYHSVELGTSMVQSTMLLVTQLSTNHCAVPF